MYGDSITSVTCYATHTHTHVFHDLYIVPGITFRVTRKSRNNSLKVVKSMAGLSSPATNPATCAFVRLGKDDSSRLPTKSATYCRLLWMRRSSIRNGEGGGGEAG